MEVIAPLGSVYQAGTLSGNPIAMAAGIAQLSILRDHPQHYQKINELGKRLAAGLKAAAEEAGIDVCINAVGSLCSVFFTKEAVVDYETAKTSDTERFAKFFHGMLDAGIYLGPSQFEAAFISAAHTEEAIDLTIEEAKRVMKTL